MKTLPALVAYLILSIGTLGGAMASARSDSNGETTIQTPSGTVTLKEEMVEPIPQEITEANSEKVQEFNRLAHKAEEFLKWYIPAGDVGSLEEFDEAFQLWQSDERQPYSKEDVIEILGAHLGKVLIERFEMEWVLVVDEYGSDYAVRAKKSEILSFPFSSVSKRIEDGKNEFMVSVFHAVEHVIESGDVKSRLGEDDS